MQVEGIDGRGGRDLNFVPSDLEQGDPGQDDAPVANPKGWVIQGNTPNSLTLAPANAKNKVPGDHLGKLAVRVLPKAPQQPTTTTIQKINGQPGRLVKSSAIDVKTQDPKKLAAPPPSVRQERTQINLYMTYRLADGRWTDIAAPASLGWDDSYLATFASSVKVLDGATAGH